jgi:hypothetical protein
MPTVSFGDKLDTIIISQIVLFWPSLTWKPWHCLASGMLYTDRYSLSENHSAIIIDSCLRSSVVVVLEKQKPVCLYCQCFFLTFFFKQLGERFAHLVGTSTVIGSS